MGWTASQRLQEVLATPRRTVLRLPDTRVIEREDLLQIITPSLRHGGLNEVSFCRFGPRNADREIDAALSRFDAAGVRCRWGVYPDCLPVDLARRLAGRGLRGTRVDALYTEAPLAAAPAPPGLEVRRVGRDEVGTYSRLMAEGWHLDGDALATLNAVAVEDPRMCLYVGTVDGEPAAVASAMLATYSVFLQGALVLPRFRGRGLYRALVERRVADAFAEGRTLAFTHALAASSSPALRRMGFEELFRFESFSPPPRA